MRYTFLLFMLMFSMLSIAQESEGRLDDKIDQVTYDWDLEADKLATYEGLLFVCGNIEYRQKIIGLLNDVHHLDSVLYEVLLKVSRTSSDKEVKKTLKDIEKFEKEYGTKSFIHFMNSECKAAKEIEKNADDLRKQVGQDSYSGQVYILETELFKYVKHITHRVDKIRLHVHHLSSHYE